ncbi:MAG: 3-phosphoshikimate 1-carboxyvinyltransferase [Deltaproteobacteria bacterium]|nr:3-phosphoshikimate 1-carboxyvinyltransferase [Deltaproteobacteria bacterium]
MLEIKPRSLSRAEVQVPGSKSYTHRVLIAAALAQGRSSIEGALFSRDTQLTAAALTQMGAQITADAAARHFAVAGCGGRFVSGQQEIFLENSGTSMRLLTAIAALGQGEYILDGSPRMRQRPMAELLNALKQLKIDASALHHNGCPPIRIVGGPIAGGPVQIDCGVSSQYLSALLLMGPLTGKGLEIEVIKGPVSRPYVDLTLAVMRRFGISVDAYGYDKFKVAGGQCYRAGTCQVEPDCSQAGYFWAAAAITGAEIKVRGISADSAQGDLGFVRVLEKMGCRVVFADDGISVIGGPLRALTVDMGDMPDLVPTLAVVAAFAEGTTVMTNVAHLRAKESDRLAAVATELGKMGIVATCSADAITVTGGQPRGAQIKTYDDHRIAMSFSLAGLNVAGVKIEDEMCVGKSFPDYWSVFAGLN